MTKIKELRKEAREIEEKSKKLGLNIKELKEQSKKAKDMKNYFEY